MDGSSDEGSEELPSSLELSGDDSFSCLVVFLAEVLLSLCLMPFETVVFAAREAE